MLLLKALNGCREITRLAVSVVCVLVSDEMFYYTSSFRHLFCRLNPIGNCIFLASWGTLKTNVWSQYWHFFSCSEHLGHVLSFGCWFPLDCILLNSCLLTLPSLQLLGLTQFPASNAFKRNICDVLLSPLDQSSDEFLCLLCSRLELLNSTNGVINPLKRLYTLGA